MFLIGSSATHQAARSPLNTANRTRSALINMTAQPASSSSKARPAVTDPSTTALLQSLRQASLKSPANPKPLIRSTVHKVPAVDPKGKGKATADEYQVTSWKTVEFAYRKAATVGIGKDLPTLARGLFTLGATEGQPEERLLVRGYDKFFNIGEMGWTKPASIERYSCPPYSLTFKENGCIIFISALSPHQLIVTSKHALDGNKTGADAPAAEDDEVDEVQTSDAAESSTKVTHAGKGEEWLGRHLSKVGKTKTQLAAELWRRGETAVAELCDDTFEEHVLAYPPERSGLHLHGLNSNAVDFHTRSMEEVEEFAHQWGFIPTRHITLQSMQEVKEFTDRIGTTGEWQGEAIEGFVVRTRVPQDAVPSSTKEEGIAAPPYAPNQVWFYKVKYDEPYLMYRDWRELAKKMLTEKTKWETENSKAAATKSTTPAVDPSSLEPISTVGPNGEPKSKNQLKREKKARGMMIARQTAAASAGSASVDAPLPEPPRARSNRPETRLFIQWCYERMYGSPDGKVKPNMTLFQGINVGKGIIHLRDTFLRYLESPEGRQRLEALGGARGALAARLGENDTGTGISPAITEADAARAARPFTHLLVVPVAVPGCGKTALFVALRHLFPGLVAHTQSDDVKSKKTAPQFLKNICEELSHSRVVLADRNNHLLKHRDEIVEAVRAWEERGGKSEEEERAAKKARHMANKKQKLQKGASTEAVAAVADDDGPKPRVKIVALSWSLDLLSLNTLHRLMADRIVLRGSNHQSLVADTTSAVGSRSHETILWRFLEDLETVGHAEGKGEGDRGRGDAGLDRVVRLNVEVSQEEQLKVVCDEVIFKETKDVEGLGDAFGQKPTEAQRHAALEAARDYKVDVPGSVEQQRSNVDGKKGARVPRYFGLAVELDLTAVIPALLSEVGQDSTASKGAAAMFAELRSRNRINPRPHITLVHSTSLKVKDGEGESSEVQSARRRWDRYTELVAAGTVEFAIELGNLAYDDRVMAFSIKSVYPVDKSAKASLSSEEFWELQGGQGDSTSDSVKSAAWHPHITVGTMDESIRPFEANGVMRAAEARGSGGDAADKVHLVEAPKTIRTVGRLSGMWS